MTKIIAPATSSIHNLYTLFSLGLFKPATIQRGFEWGIDESKQLLGDFDKVFSQLNPEVDEIDDIASEPDLDADEENESKNTDDDLFFQKLEHIFHQCEEMGVLEPEDATLSLSALADEQDERVMPQVPLNGYYIGNLILVEREQNHFEIFDGLQRFTTLTILFSVLRDLIDDATVKKQLNTLIHEGQQARLQSEDLKEGFEEHVIPLSATLKKRDLKGNLRAIKRKILQNKNIFLETFDDEDKWPESKLIAFANFLQSNIWVSVLQVNDMRMAGQMFVTTNQYGKKLDLIDLLRAQLAGAYKNLPEDNAEDEFTLKWTKITNFAGHRMEDFLRAFDKIERRELQPKTWPADFGAFVSENYQGDSLKKLMNRMVSYAWAWKSLQNTIYFGGDTEVEQNVFRLDVFQWPQWQALALFWWGQFTFEKKQNNPDKKRLKTLRSKLNRLHRRCMALTLARLDSKDLDVIFKKALDQERRGIDVYRNALSPKDRQRKQIDKTLRTQIRDREIWWPLMRWLEISQWRENLPRTIRGSNTEHVRPQRPDLEKHSFDLTEYEEGCYSLGNLAVISKDGHNKITNEGFQKKLPILRAEASRFITMQSVVFDKKKKQRPAWDNAVIFSRAQSLRKETWKLMGLKSPEEISDK